MQPSCDSILWSHVHDLHFERAVLICCLSNKACGWLVSGLALGVTHGAGQQFRCLWNLCRHLCGLRHIFYHPSLATVWQNGVTTNATSEPFNLGLVILSLAWSYCLWNQHNLPDGFHSLFGFSFRLVSSMGPFQCIAVGPLNKTTGLLPDNSRWQPYGLPLYGRNLLESCS